VQRGVDTFEKAKSFFRPQYTDLHDPFIMKGMKTAIERINTALAENQKILVYGDYDVDGTTAVATVYDFFSKRSNQIEYYIPDRYTEGYGISFMAIDWASNNGYSLIIALDCGIKANDKVKYLSAQIWEVIILDDETIYGKWAFDASVATELDKLKELFGVVNADALSPVAADIDEVELEVELDKVTLKIVLVETETVTECGVTEIVNKEIEVEFDIEDLSDLLDGEIELLAEVEDDNGRVTEYPAKGVFQIVGSTLTLTLEIEDGDDTIERTLVFTK
jgi:single-stranded-DNA-specific exonuclease